MPDYSGLVADVAANYRVHATKFDVLFARDITYSYETTQPYYLLTNVGLKVLQKVTTHWDLTGNLVASGSATATSSRRAWSAETGWIAATTSAAVSGTR